MEIQGTVYEDPARAVIFYKWGKAETVEATEETQIRYQGGIKSPILKDLEQGEEMLLLEELDNWSRVMTRDGIDGYVENGSLSSVGEMEYTYTGSYEEDFTSLTRDHKINLAWHQVTSEAANQAFASDTQNMTGVNVISPTWFSVTSTQGNISSLASSDYVSQAHAKGLEVWGLIDNFDDEVSTLDTLSVRSARQHIIDMLLSEAKRVDLDGINVDFEALTEEEAPHFIQFIRELSVACRNNGLVLSVDNPVPQYTAFYNRKEQGIVADYVIIMGYDEHTVGSETAGSVASLPFVEEGIAQTLSEVPKEKVINGIPFYTRLWTEANNGMVTSEVCSMDQADAYVEKYNMEVYWNTDVSQNYAEAVTDSGVSLDLNGTTSGRSSVAMYNKKVKRWSIMAEYEMFKTTLMGGYDKEEVQEQIQRLKDEMAENQEAFKKQLEEKDARIAELQKRIELKEDYQARLEEDIKEKYQKYIDNYESIGKLVFEAQVKADTLEKETKEKCDKMLQDAEEEAKRKVESVQAEIDDKLLEGKKKYLAVQEEMNGIVELINQAQKRFMSSYKEVHHIISSMPTSLNDLEEDVEMELHEMEAGKAENPETDKEEELHLGDTQELDFLDSVEDIAELEEFDEEDEEEDEDSKLALQISKLLSEEDEAILEEELEDL